MKKTMLLMLVVALALCVTPNAWAIEGWADSVVDFDRGTLSPTGDDPTQALFETDSLNSSIPKDDTFYQIGNTTDAFLTVGFSNAIILQGSLADPMDDVEVYEFGGPEDFDIQLEVGGSIFTYTSMSLFGYRDNGPLPNDRVNVYTFDLGNIGDANINQLSIVNAWNDGTVADIDAIKGISVTPEPISMALFLIGGVPIGMRLYKKRKKTVKV